MPQADQFRHNVARMNRHAAKAEAKLQRRARLRRIYYRVWSPASRESGALDCLVSNAPKPKRRYGHLVPGLAGIAIAVACFAVPGYLYYNAAHVLPFEEVAAVEQEQPEGVAETIAAALISEAPLEAAAPQGPSVSEAGVAPLPTAAAEPETVAIRGTLTTDDEPTANMQAPLVPVGASMVPASERHGRNLDSHAGAAQHADALAAALPYKLVHIANGRAMIEDEHGVTIVERGSRLPDNNQVAAIEQRDGRWVMVTSADEILTATE